LATAAVVANSTVSAGSASNAFGQVPGSGGMSAGEAPQESPVATLAPVETMQAVLQRPAPVPLTDFSSQAAGADPPSRTVIKGRSRWMTAMAATILIAGGVVAYSLAQSSGSSNAGDTPRQLLAAASSAARKAGSVHVVVRIQVPGQTATYVNDSAPSSGRQVITSSSGLRVTSLVIDGTAYVKANQVGMTTLFQSPVTTAQRFADTWLSFSSSGSEYEQIVDSLTLSSLLKEVIPQSAVTKLPTSIVNGQTVVGIRGHLPGGVGGTLFVPLTGSTLPVEEVSHASGGTTTAIFSDWGRSITVTRPPHSIPGSSISSLLGEPGTAADDRAAQSNLVNALTEALALYQTSQSFCEVSCAGGVTPMTLAAIQSSAPEFTWSNGAVTSGDGVSIQPVDVTTPGGSGDGVILAVMSKNTNTCWYAVDLESPPVPAFADPTPNIDFAQAQTASGRGQWEAPTGGTAQKLGAGVFYAKATVGAPVTGSPTSSQGCVAGFPVGRPAGDSTTWKWGSSFTNAPNL
jgi:hypothetical protein